MGKGSKTRPLLGDDTTTIFSSPQSMDSDERDAVRKGEARGKLEAMKERPEHYGCIGNENTIKYRKGYNFAFGHCVGCEKFNPEHDDSVGAYCKLPENAHCIRTN